MLHEYDDEDDLTPKRDSRGRFRKGQSGNWRGRPRKAPPEEWSLASAFRKALMQRVPISGPDGPQVLEMRDLLVQSLVRSLPKAKPRDIFFIFERLVQLGAFEQCAQESEGIFTEEHYKLLETIEREFPDLIGKSDPSSPGSTGIIGREGSYV